MAASVTFDQLLITSLYKYASTEFNDNFFEGLRTTKVLMSKPGWKKTVAGGDFLVVPVTLARNPSSKWLGEWDQFDVSNRDTGVQTQYNWKFLGGSLDVSMKELAVNREASKMIDLVEYKTQVLKSSMLTDLNSAIFSDGTDPNQPVGLEAIISATGVLGGVDPATYSTWASTVDSTAEAFSITKLDHVYNSASHNIDEPDVIITNQTNFESYATSARANIRFTDEKIAQLGFGAMQFRGATIFWDAACPAGTTYLINSKQLNLYVQRDRDFAIQEARNPIQQFAITIPILWMGAIAPRQRRLHAKLTAKT